MNKDTKQSWEDILEKQLDYLLDPEAFDMDLRRSVVVDVVRDILEQQRHDLKEQVLEVVGEPIELKTPLTVNYTDMEIKKLLTENELRSDIKERIEAVFEK